MNVDDSKNSLRSDWARVDALDDATIDQSDVSELTDSFFASAELRLRPAMTEVHVPVDSAVLKWFQSTGSDWPRRLNAALRLYAEAHQNYETSPNVD